LSLKHLILALLLMVSLAAILPASQASAQESGDGALAQDRREETASDAGSQLEPEEEVAQPTFAINEYEVRGNTLLPLHMVWETLSAHTGPEMTADSVQAARDDLESLFHKQGYPAVLVNIPEQTVEHGLVVLEVVESKIRRVRITGNRYFTHELILSKLPSFRTGRVLYLPDIQRELGELNANPDIQVEPQLTPGKQPGTIDIELKVTDSFPLHGHVELNNRRSHDTTELRLNALIRYDNLWQKEHSASFQFQTSPLDTEEVQVLAGSYVLPNPWRKEHFAAFYAVWSDSETAFGEGFSTVGNGEILGMRYIIPLPGERKYQHNISLGLDYKSFEESTNLEDENVETTEVTYLPVSASYTGSLPDSTGLTEFSAGLNIAIRDLVTKQEEFQVKRFQARGNYLYVTAGLERSQNLPGDASLFVKLDGQVASQPLISNEQFSAGGMQSVRGYLESEVQGDHAAYASVEARSPELISKLGLGEGYSLTLHAFYDRARLYTKDPLPGEDQVTDIDGVGLGFRGSALGSLSYDFDWGMALSDTDRTKANDSVLYFQLRYQF